MSEDVKITKNVEVEKQKLEVEVALNDVKALEIICEMFHWTTEFLLQIIVKKEIEWIKQDIKDGDYKFLEEYFLKTNLPQKLLEL